MKANTTATRNLGYRELQAKLRAMKEQGHDVQVKLNAKHDVLLLEFNRLTQVLEVEVREILDTRSTQAVEETLYQLPAMNAALVPSWLAKRHRVYIVDGVDYLPYELEQQLDGSYSQLHATDSRLHVTDSELTCEYPVEDVAPTTNSQPPITDALWKNYIVQLDPTCQQAVANLAQGLRNTRALLRGLMEGLSASGRAKATLDTL